MNISAADNNNTITDDNCTPSKKRKRQQNDVNFTRVCSTPKNNIGCDNPGLNLVSPKYYHNKENLGDAFMEVKSIADLVGANPFEVIRKPPKKKKKHDIAESCFVNPALNLNGPEKEAVNPFEVRRGFGGGDVTNGVENPGLAQSPPASAGIAIALPFTPTISRRINFKDLPSDALTPAGMLAKNLVFSPEMLKTTPNSRNFLSIISEEALDIDEELDCYQLELENSINEAKTRGKKGRSLIEIKQVSSLKLKLQNLPEPEEHETASVVITEVPDATFIIPEPQQNETKDETIASNSTTKEVKFSDAPDDVQFDEIDDDELEFKDPAPFKRTFRRSLRMPDKTTDSTKETTKEPQTKSHSIKDLVRRSIRKLTHSNPSKEAEPKSSTDGDHHHGLMSSIRQSFRRKQKPEKLENDVDGVSSHEISIIEPNERRHIYREPTNEGFGGGSHDGFAKPTTTGLSSIRSSFRRSTKEAKRRVMRPFTKNVDRFDFE